MKEAAVASHIRLDAPHHNCELWRNNCGVLPDENGRWIRYGLANETPSMGKQIKSSDFIGITQIVITPDMVGQTVGVFTAIETKPSHWKFLQSCKRSLAQKVFHDIVKKSGGFAGFATSIEDFRRIIKK